MGIFSLESSTKRLAIENALVDMIINDLQPASIVEDKGFVSLINVLDPRYALPSRRTISRSLLPRRYAAIK